LSGNPTLSKKGEVRQSEVGKGDPLEYDVSISTNTMFLEATMLIIAYPRDEGFFARAPFEYQLDPKMAKMDELLEDERLILRVGLDLAQSAPQALETGRPATPVEVTLRLAVLRRLNGWSYRQVEDEVKGSLKWRGFCHIYDHDVPDHSTIQAREAVIASETLHALNDLVVEQAQAKGVTQGKKLRTDSSVVETHIHYPTDSSLLADGVRVLGRTVARAREVVDGRVVRWHKTVFRNQGRKAKHLARQIAFLARRQGQKKPENRLILSGKCAVYTVNWSVWRRTAKITHNRYSAYCLTGWAI
jgi:IS5 family transposase